jgi:transposase
MGEYSRRMKGRLGKAQGITATAHKLARIIHSLIASGQAYDEAQAFRPNPASEKKQLKTLRSLAEKLGFQITSNPATAMS